MSKIYINDYSLITAQGDSKESISDRIFSSNYLRPDEFLLTSGRAVPCFLYTNNLPQIDTPKFNSRNNRLILKALRSVEDKVHSFIEQYGSKRVGVVFGTSTSGIEEGINAVSLNLDNRKDSSYQYALQEVGSPSDFVQSYLKTESFSYTVSTACSSGAKAFIEAKKLLINDMCDVVIVGGADTVNKLTLNGFDCLELVSSKHTNPFSKNRNGINIGEGAAVFVVSKEQSELELLGVGESSDGYHISSPDPSGKGAIISMENALSDARISGSDVDYINLHGTATINNDQMESVAVSEVFSENTFCSSTKPFTGHTLGAAGAIEIGFCCLAIENNKLPFHIWDGEFDPDLPRLNFVNKNSKSDVNICLSNSFAFGGNNASVIVGRN